MRNMNEQFQTIFLFSTHDERIIKQAQSLIRLRDGVIVQ